MQGLQPLPSEKVDVEEREGQDDFPRRVHLFTRLACRQDFETLGLICVHRVEIRNDRKIRNDSPCVSYR